MPWSFRAMAYMASMAGLSSMGISFNIIGSVLKGRSYSYHPNSLLLLKCVPLLIPTFLTKV